MVRLSTVAGKKGGGPGEIARDTGTGRQLLSESGFQEEQLLCQAQFWSTMFCCHRQEARSGWWCPHLPSTSVLVLSLSQYPCCASSVAAQRQPCLSDLYSPSAPQHHSLTTHRLRCSLTRCFSLDHLADVW